VGEKVGPGARSPQTEWNQNGKFPFRGTMGLGKKKDSLDWESAHSKERAQAPRKKGGAVSETAQIAPGFS